jgi:hypothetical protein
MDGMDTLLEDVDGDINSIKSNEELQRLEDLGMPYNQNIS